MRKTLRCIVGVSIVWAVVAITGTAMLMTIGMPFGTALVRACEFSLGAILLIASLYYAAFLLTYD